MSHRRSTPPELSDSLRRKAQTAAEELSNSLSHAAGTLLAIMGMIVLVVSASRHGDTWHIVSCAVFGATLVLLYSTSTAYHATRYRPAKRVLQQIDHAAIFLLIAGTYTPFTLVNMRGPTGWTLFGVVWGLALFGIAMRITRRKRSPLVFLPLYLGMGWAVLAALKPLFQTVPAAGILLLAAGGVAYTAGVVFYRWHSLPYHHAIWHLFVLTGSVFHYVAVLLYVIPSGSAGP